MRPTIARSWLPAMPVPSCRGVEQRVRVASQHLEIYSRGVRRILAGTVDQPIAKCQRCREIGISHYPREAAHYAGPIRLVRRLAPWHEHGEPRQQLPRATFDQCRAGFHFTKLVQRAFHELLELIEPASDGSIEPARCPDQIEEPGRVHLQHGEVGQLRQLFRVSLWSRDDEAQSGFRSLRRRVDDGSDELPDEIPRRLVAHHQIR